MGKYEQKAEQLFREGYNCAQAVAGAFAPLLDMPQAQVFKLASGFGGGFGRLRSVCGAVSGATMVLGMVRGYDDATDTAAKKETYERIRKMIAQFEAENGSMYCNALLKDGADRSATPTERTAEFYKKRPCAVLVRYAAALVEKELGL